MRLIRKHVQSVLMGKCVFIHKRFNCRRALKNTVHTIMVQSQIQGGYVNALWARQVLQSLTRTIREIERKIQCLKTNGSLDQFSEFNLYTTWSSFVAMTCEDGPCEDGRMMSLQELSLKSLASCDLAGFRCQTYTGQTLDIFQFLESKLCTDRERPRLTFFKCFVRFIGVQKMCELLPMLSPKTVRSLAFTSMGVKSLSGGNKAAAVLLSAYYADSHNVPHEFFRPIHDICWIVFKEYSELTGDSSMLWQKLGSVMVSSKPLPEFLGSALCEKELINACSSVVNGSKDCLAGMHLIRNFLIGALQCSMREPFETHSQLGRLRRSRLAEYRRLAGVEWDEFNVRITAAVSRIIEQSLILLLDHCSNHDHSRPHFQSIFAQVLEYFANGTVQDLMTKEELLRLGLIITATCLGTAHDEIQEIRALDERWVPSFEDRLLNLSEWDYIEHKTGEFIAQTCLLASLDSHTQFDFLVFLLARLLWGKRQNQYLIGFLAHVIVHAVECFSKECSSNLKPWCKRIRTFVKSKVYTNTDFRGKGTHQIELFLRELVATKDTRALIASFWRPKGEDSIPTTPLQKLNFATRPTPESTPGSVYKQNFTNLAGSMGAASPTFSLSHTNSCTGSPWTARPFFANSPTRSPRTPQTNRSSRFLSPRQSLFRVRDTSPTPQKRPSAFGKML